MLQLYPRSVVFSITPVVLPIGEPPRNITPLKGKLPGSKKSAGMGVGNGVSQFVPPFVVKRTVLLLPHTQPVVAFENTTPLRGAIVIEFCCSQLEPALDDLLIPPRSSTINASSETVKNT